VSDRPTQWEVFNFIKSGPGGRSGLEINEHFYKDKKSMLETQSVVSRGMKEGWLGLGLGMRIVAKGDGPK
jgi:hypothetical protein